jgi:nicotinamidase-related amidase
MMTKVACMADRNQSQLVIVDMQTKLSSVMSDHITGVIKNCAILLQSAALLEIPSIFTEQYPKGLGPTLPELSKYAAGKKAVEKTAFSCCGDPAFNRQLLGDHTQVILAGMEAHICVLQTALDLIAQGKTVFVLEDAVISRNPENKRNALNRMREAGVIISNTESLVFEWLGAAEGDAFKKISQLVR